MAGSEDLISFDTLEPHKENIQSVPSGRSAKLLAAQLSPLNAVPSNGHSITDPVNAAIRADFERELEGIEDADDPLDVYDRYIKWTIEAYPSAQNTPASGLVPLLERATQAFLGHEDYRNDPRYLRIWLQYFKVCGDMHPRESYAHIASNGIGLHLALFYEEFAAYLEQVGNWKQAEEVYQMGAEKNARPKDRLTRKFNEFQKRREEKQAQGNHSEGPRSPALPRARKVLAEIRDDEEGEENPQAQHRPIGEARTKTGRAKMQVYEDSSEAPILSGKEGGWQPIVSLEQRRKENKHEVQTWAGQKMNMERRNIGVPKMMVYEDPTNPKHQSKRQLRLPKVLPEKQKMPNPKTGRIDFVFVKLDAVYPEPSNPSVEFCFEELRARERGWLDIDWRSQGNSEKKQRKALGELPKDVNEVEEEQQIDQPEQPQPKTLPLNDLEDQENNPASQEQLEAARRRRREAKEAKLNRTRKIQVMEVKAPAQSVQANLDSPTRPKLKRKKSGNATATMTINTREAMDEVYGLFNQTLKLDEQIVEEEMEEDESDEESEDDYTDGGESTGTGTGRISGTTSEYGDETRNELLHAKAGEPSTEADTEAKEAEGWSEYTMNKDDSETPETGEVTEKSEHSRFEVYHDPTMNGTQREVYQEDLASPVEADDNDDDAENDLPHTTYIPIPLEDFAMPPNPYRNPELVAQSRLPFMTPIAEKTESSLGAISGKGDKGYIEHKTPSRPAVSKTPAVPQADAELWSSPFEEVVNESNKKPTRQPLQPILTGSRPKKTKPEAPLPTPKSIERAVLGSRDDVPKGPVIKDLQCNPVDDHIRQMILDSARPPLASYAGYFENRHEDYGRTAELRRYAKANVKGANAPLLDLPGTDRIYTVKRELGKGAFAPVYLVESKSADVEDTSKDHANDENAIVRMGQGAFSTRKSPLEALKSEHPPTPWEFYIIRQAHRRLGVSRPAESIIRAHEMHLFRDECYLVLDYRDQGTLLDVINLGKDPAASLNGSAPSAGVMDETLAMWFTVEMMRTMEALHKIGIIHGDLKADNVLVRLDDCQIGTTYRADGSDGWSSKGLSLIDFGRGIDMRVFQKDVQFIADWKTGSQDCAEMRELRPWTYQVDYHGLAGVIHSLLFGKYIETVAERAGTILGQGATKRYRIKESLKRYWQTEIWSEVFDLLLNPLLHLQNEDGNRMPVLRGLKDVRERMERWIEENCDRGTGLRTLIKKVEHAVKERRR